MISKPPHIGHMMKPVTVLFSAAFLWLAGSAAPVLAGGLPAASASFSHSDLTLHPGGFANGTWTAGLEIVIKGNWKTYWRMPGDAGIPPQFDWSGSKNLKSVKVLWPAPERYNDAAGESIGYKHHVAFPLVVTPLDTGKPATLSLKLFYAICEDVCIPAEASLSVTLKPVASAPGAVVAKYLKRVPAGRVDGLQLVSASLTKAAGKPALKVVLSGGKVTGTTEIFVEGNDDLYFAKPVAQPASGTTRTFILAISGLDKPEKISARPLTLTIISGEARLERAVRLR